MVVELRDKELPEVGHVASFLTICTYSNKHMRQRIHTHHSYMCICTPSHIKVHKRTIHRRKHLQHTHVTHTWQSLILHDHRNIDSHQTATNCKAKEDNLKRREGKLEDKKSGIAADSGHVLPKESSYVLGARKETNWVAWTAAKRRQ